MPKTRPGATASAQRQLCKLLSSGRLKLRVKHINGTDRAFRPSQAVLHEAESRPAEAHAWHPTLTSGDRSYLQLQQEADLYRGCRSTSEHLQLVLPQNSAICVSSIRTLYS